MVSYLFIATLTVSHQSKIYLIIFRCKHYLIFEYCLYSARPCVHQFKWKIWYEMYFCKDLLFYYARVIASYGIYYYSTCHRAIQDQRISTWTERLYIITHWHSFHHDSVMPASKFKKPKQNVVIDRTDSILLRRTRVALMLHVASTYENY